MAHSFYQFRVYEPSSWFTLNHTLQFYAYMCYSVYDVPCKTYSVNLVWTSLIHNNFYSYVNYQSNWLHEKQKKLTSHQSYFSPSLKFPPAPSKLSPQPCSQKHTFSQLTKTIHLLQETHLVTSPVIFWAIWFQSLLTVGLLLSKSPSCCFSSTSHLAFRMSPTRFYSQVDQSALEFLKVEPSMRKIWK